MPGPFILIAHPDRKTQRTMQRVLSVTGCEIEVAESLLHAQTRLASAPLLVVLDGNLTDTSEGKAFLAVARETGTEAVALTGHVSDILPHVLVHRMPVLGEELTVTVQKLIRRDLFGADKYLLWGTALHAHTITRSSQRAPLVSQLADDIKACGQTQRVAQMAMLVADELMSNAIHNAPVDRDGTHFRRDVRRDAEIELAERESVRLRWGCDARYLAVEVNDRFGSLDRETVLGALARTAVTDSGAGAGMGLSLAYRSCDHLVFNLSPGKRTEIIALIDVRSSPAERGPVSSYNVFVERA